MVALQKGDAAVRKIWKAFCDESLRHCHEIYRRLGVSLIDRGESFYNDLMDEVVRRLEKIRDERSDPAVRDSDGAVLRRGDDMSVKCVLRGAPRHHARYGPVCSRAWTRRPSRCTSHGSTSELTSSRPAPGPGAQDPRVSIRWTCC